MTWEDQLERTRNYDNNHIPIGLYHDLIDMGVEPPSFDIVGDWVGIINDDTRGFTIAQLFSCLTSNIVNVPLYQNCIITQRLQNAPNTARQVNNLFNNYSQ